MLENVPAAVGHALGSIRPGLGKLVYAHADLAAAETAMRDPGFGSPDT